MTAGDILRTGLFAAEKVKVKANEDIELGEVICDDGSGNGMVAATQTLLKTGLTPFVALAAHDYSEVSYHYKEAALFGKVTVQKKAGTAIKQGDKVAISSTAGEVEKYTKGDMPAGGVSTYYTTAIEASAQTALDTSNMVVGTCAEDAAADATTVDIWLGVK